MTARFSDAEERRQRQGVNLQGPRADAVPSDGGMLSGQMRQTDSRGGTLRGVPSFVATEARSRLGRMKLNAVKDELRRAERSFVAAKRSLRDRSAQEAAGRIADALGRVNCAVNSVAKGAAVHPAVEALVGVSRFDPTNRPQDFTHLAGKSIALTGRVLAACGFDAIAYWGRTLCRLAQAFVRQQPGTAA